LLNDIKEGNPFDSTIIAGHHRARAYLDLCLMEGKSPIYYCHIFDLNAEGVDEFLKIEAINYNHPDGIPDYYHVLFKKVLGPERLR
jgi:hypothetical protein